MSRPTWMSPKGWDGKGFHLGRYQLGYRMVDVYCEPGNGGSFNLCRDERDPEIHVGMGYADQGYAFSVLCHEVWEMAAKAMNCSFVPDSAFVPHASDVVVFFYDHNQHTELVAHVSYFLIKVVDDFRKAFAYTKAGPKKRPLARKRSGK